MKKRFSIFLLLAAGGATTGRAQVSPVVGFIQRTVAGAPADGISPTSTVLSFPLYDAAKFTGNVAVVNGPDTLTAAGASWTAGQFTATPHLVRVVSGRSTGRWFLVAGHTTAALTVANRGLDLAALLAAGDGIEVMPAHTLGSVFGTVHPLLQASGEADAADVVSVWNGRKFKNYHHNGTSWVKGVGTASQGGVVLPPDAGVLVTRRAAGSVTVTLNGRLPDTSERSDVPGPGTTFLANRFPVDASLGALGLNGLVSWQTASNAESADTVLLFKKGAWMPYFFDGSAWHAAGKSAVADAKAIPAGSAVMVVRQSTAALGSDAATLAQDPPYATD